MTERSNLVRLGKVVAAELNSGAPGPATKLAARLLEEVPEQVLALVDLMAKEGAKKRPDDGLTAAYALLLAHALEHLRYAVERDEPDAIALADRLRAHLRDAGERGRLGSTALLLIMKQFAAAKLEAGDALRELMQGLLLAGIDAPEAATDDDADGGEHLTRVAEMLGGDLFAIHGYLDESAEALPEELRAGIVMAAFAQPEPALREAVLGFLLNGSPLVRTKLAELIAIAAPQGLVSGTMLRRMIAIRNWLPEADRPTLDRAIKACRVKGVPCAGWPQPVVREVLASGFDGAGAETVLAVVADGPKHALAALLIKQNIGVRDAWVRRGLGNRELRELLSQVADKIAIAPTSLPYVSAAVRHFLSINARSGVMPVFGIIDFAEMVGLIDLIPAALPVDTLVAALRSEIDGARLSDGAIAETLRGSARLVGDHPILDTWFLDDTCTARVIAGKRLSRAKQKAALLAGPLQEGRWRWAELAAWTAHAAKHDPSGARWEDLVIVAGELLSDRPLDEIALMGEIAECSVAFLKEQALSRLRSAAA